MILGIVLDKLFQCNHKINNKMKRIVQLFLTFLVIATIISCEEDDPAKNIERLEGQWSVNENTDLSKSAEDAYVVYISVDPSDSTRILIDGFYGLSIGTSVVSASYNGDDILTLSSQTFANDFHLISGSGAISSSFKEINWSYRIDPGDGQPDDVTATYTKSGI